MMKMKMMIGNRRNGIRRTNNKVYFIRVQSIENEHEHETSRQKSFDENLVELQE